MYNEILTVMDSDSRDGSKKGKGTEEDSKKKGSYLLMLVMRLASSCYVVPLKFDVSLCSGPPGEFAGYRKQRTKDIK